MRVSKKGAIILSASIAFGGSTAASAYWLMGRLKDKPKCTAFNTRTPMDSMKAQLELENTTNSIMLEVQKRWNASQNHEEIINYLNSQHAIVEQCKAETDSMGLFAYNHYLYDQLKDRIGVLKEEWEGHKKYWDRNQARGLERLQTRSP